MGVVAKLKAVSGLIVLTAFISPFRTERELVRRLLPSGEFIEIYLATPLTECERRDPKGLYRKARRGEIPDFTGIDSPYEAPEAPELRFDTSDCSAETCAGIILEYLAEMKLI